MMQYAALWLTLWKLLALLSVKLPSHVENISQTWQDAQLSANMTTSHGNGAQWGCETAGRQWCMFLYFCLVTLEDRLAHCDTLMFVYYKDNIVQDIAFNLSVFVCSCGIIYSLHLSHSAFLAPLFTCASWGQDQAWAVKTSTSKFTSLQKCRGHL